jgi:hypothetical protein
VNRRLHLPTNTHKRSLGIFLMKPQKMTTAVRRSARRAQKGRNDKETDEGRHRNVTAEDHPATPGRKTKRSKTTTNTSTSVPPNNELEIAQNSFPAKGVSQRIQCVPATDQARSLKPKLQNMAVSETKLLKRKANQRERLEKNQRRKQRYHPVEYWKTTVSLKLFMVLGQRTA